MRTVTPQPGYTEADVEAQMHSGQFVYADCFTFSPKVGSPIRYTNVQQDVSVVPVGFLMRETYQARKVNLKGLRVHNTLGTEVDEQQVEMNYPETAIYQASLTWAQALLQGRLDGARIRRDRYIAARFGNGPAQNTLWMGGMTMFKGLVSTLDKVGRMTATLNVKSDLILLNTQMPGSLFEAQCKNTWGDTACGVNQGDWVVNPATVGASPTRTVIPWSGAAQDYNEGKIHIENNDDVTRVRTISRVSGGNLYLAYPLDFDPIAGQEMAVYPNCGRTSNATFGCPKYHGDPAWRSKYKGFPFIPVAETAA